MPQQTITARDLPTIRAELATWLADPGPLGGPAVWSQHLDSATAAQERQAAADWSVSLRAAQLTYANGDMTGLAASAGLALPAYRLHPEDLPAPHGLIMWENPVISPEAGGDVMSSIAVSWAVHGGGVHIRVWTKREEWFQWMARPEPGMGAMSQDEIRVMRARYPQALVSTCSSYLPFGKVPGWLLSDYQDTTDMSIAELENRARFVVQSEMAERALVTSWLLMGQVLVREEEVQAPKGAAKHIRRLDPNLLTSVRYVTLRHRSIHAERTGQVDGAGVTYRHRWIVSGHWRNHWYPSQQRTRPIWIANHMKGPEGAPILDPDKLVNLLRR
ncbi:hypothetical protein [Streptomyces subrutilus]|uniref:Uncharacterized protein n=1 Tax=Streptomyces subrutilus TaxID=36818 RepID=A0A1E5NY12_9ACTN|nr:hypothetical protein [Streptomyces subrutilus]OEJ21027.1 hypothetical protein BGK67_34590 [Streptomyces subrutilus]